MPGDIYTWTWNEASAAAATNRFGFAAWGQQDAHYTLATAAKIESQAEPASLSITSVALAGNDLVIQIANPGNVNFDVEATTTLQAGSWTTVASNQSGTTWSTPITGGEMFFRLRAR
jgi:hypothetical protein